MLNGKWLAEGTHLNVVGSNFLGKAEVDAVAVRRCESIIVDSKDQARLEAGDFVQALEEGSIHWADIHELGQVIVGRFTGRAHPQDVTLFKSLGIALEDIAVAAKVYAKAMETSRQNGRLVNARGDERKNAGERRTRSPRSVSFRVNPLAPDLANSHNCRVPGLLSSTGRAADS